VSIGNRSNANREPDAILSIWQTATVLMITLVCLIGYRGLSVSAGLEMPGLIIGEEK
jgi:hypothetical protein